MSDQEMKELMQIKEFLPAEGESIVITRHNGKLQTGKISLSISTEGGLFNHEKELGELLALNKKLAEVGVGCSLFFGMAFIAAWLVWTHFKTSEWYVYLGAIVIALVIYFQLDEWYSDIRKRQIFASEGIDVLTNVMRSLQLTEAQLLAKIARTEKLEHIETCFSHYMKSS